MEKKNSLILGVSEHFVKHEIELGIGALKNAHVPNDIIDAFVAKLKNGDRQELLEKSQLWEELHERFKKLNIQDKGTVIIKIVNEVVDEKHNLQQTLQAMNLPLYALQQGNKRKIARTLRPEMSPPKKLKNRNS